MKIIQIDSRGIEKSTKLIEEISSREIKIHFILANSFREILAQNGKLGVSDLEDIYEQQRKQFQGMEEQELDRKITDKQRLRRYNLMQWHKKNIPLSDIGVWPEMGSLDIRLTIGSAVDTARTIESCRNNGSQFYLPRGLINKFDSMRKRLDFIYLRFPLILFPGGEIRDGYNQEASQNNRPLFSILKYDSDDGSCRSVVYVLENLTKVPAYAGKYRS